MRKKPSIKKKRRLSYFYLIFSLLFLVITAVSYSVTTVFLRSFPEIPQCANSKSCTSDLTEQIQNNVPGTFAGKTVSPPVVNLADDSRSQAVLGDTTVPGEKHIYVDLSKQTLYAYQGSSLVLQTLVSTGKWAPTPVGNFHVWIKLRSTRMTGGEGADAYDLPNVEYVMYFYHDFGLHTAYWHDNFGHEMSHGCVNLRRVDAKSLYEWADGPSGDTKGTAVSICNQITSDNQCVQNNPLQS